MDIKDIPVKVVGPGSQPDSADGKLLSTIDMPSDMATYQKPHIPEPAAVIERDGAREAMFWLRDTLRSFDPSTTPKLADLSALDEENRELVNQILGEGEVSVKFDGTVRARSQESVLAGVWRTLYLDDGDGVYQDLLEVAGIPHTVCATEGREDAAIEMPDDMPAGMNNVLAILSELESARQRFAESQESYSINLTLLPLSEDEIAFIDGHLGRGPVDVLSRAYGKCQVISTAIANTWWVRYFNSMGTLILNTLEIVDVPNVVAAADEDIDDSAVRLQELLEPYWSDVG